MSKRVFSVVLAMLVCLSALPWMPAPKVRAVTANQQNIVDRADYLYSLTWVAQKTVSAHAYNYYYTYYAGNTYHLPYGQGDTSYYIGYGVTPENFVAAASDANSVFYRYKSYAGSWYSTYYISDCSGFVSWCWGLTAKQSTRSLANYSTYVASVTTSNIRNYLQVGDALNRYDYHVVLVTDLEYDSAGNLVTIEITEQTIPETKRSYYTPAGLASAYASYDGIYRYKGNVPASPYKPPAREETWIEKAAFDVMVYRDRNPDLAHMTDAQLKEHWLKSGIKEGRASSPVLDLGFYRNNNPDLKEAFGNDYEALYNHFVTKGYKEYRKSSALFDGSYYCEKYPDVAENYKEKYLLHYMDHGMAEGRRASLTYDPDYYLFIRPDVAEVWPDDYSMAAKHYAGHGINAQIEAYDHEHPVISNAEISDISPEGYTVTCTVKDNWSISKVAFPVWTEQNGQDDLAEAFMDTQLGTCSGSTYTFRVKTSDHNHELGRYVTHIYAFDRGGNRTQLVLDAVEIKEEVGSITPREASGYVIKNACLTNVSLSTTVDRLMANMENETLQILDPNGQAISGSDVVVTGAKINLYNGSKLVDTVTVSVLGDLDGNGSIDSTDYLRIKAAFLEQYQLSSLEMGSADMDFNNVLDSTDYLKLKDYFLGMSEI
jgi:hypothetical protein